MTSSPKPNMAFALPRARQHGPVGTSCLKEVGKPTPAKARGWRHTLEGSTIKGRQHGPSLVALPWPSALVRRHVRKRPMTACDGSSGALQGTHALARPGLPRRKGLERPLRGEPVGIPRGVAPLQGLAHPRCPAGTAGRRPVVGPRGLGSQGLPRPSPLACRQARRRPILLHACPPAVPQSRQGWPWLPDRGPDGVPGRERMLGGQRVPGLHLRVHPACGRRGCVPGGIRAVAGMDRAREGLKVPPVRARHLGPARAFGPSCRQPQGALPVVGAPWGPVLVARALRLRVRPRLRGLASPPAQRAQNATRSHGREASRPAYSSTRSRLRHVGSRRWREH